MIIHLQKIPQSLHLNAIWKRNKVHITVSVFFSLAFFLSHWLSFSGIVGFLSLLMLSQEILYRDKTKLFLGSKQICTKLSYFMLQGFMKSFGFWFIWSHILRAMLWILYSDKSKNSRQNSVKSANTVLPLQTDCMKVIITDFICKWKKKHSLDLVHYKISPSVTLI